MPDFYGGIITIAYKMAWSNELSVIWPRIAPSSNWGSLQQRVVEQRSIHVLELFCAGRRKRCFECSPSWPSRCARQNGIWKPFASGRKNLEIARFLFFHLWSRVKYLWRMLDLVSCASNLCECLCFCLHLGSHICPCKFQDVWRVFLFFFSTISFSVWFTVLELYCDKISITYCAFFFFFFSQTYFHLEPPTFWKIFTLRAASGCFSPLLKRVKFLRRLAACGNSQKFLCASYLSKRL